jgi:hypothetical protein
MDRKLDKKMDSAGSLTTHNAVYLGIYITTVMIGGQPWTRT